MESGNVSNTTSSMMPSMSTFPSFPNFPSLADFSSFSTPSISSVVAGILLFVLVLVCIFLFTRITRGKSSGVLLLKYPVSIQTSPRLCQKKITSSDRNESTISIWTYVKEWNASKNAADKFIFMREYNDHMLYVFYPQHEPQLNIVILPKTKSFHTSNYGFFVVKNIHLQRWNNITISQWGRTLDVFLNGKLVRTFILKMELTASIPEHIEIGKRVTFPSYLPTFKAHTFEGFISRILYYPRTISVHEVYNIYARGPGVALNNVKPLEKINLQLSI